MMTDAEELIDDWESIRQGYFLGEHDQTVLSCVERIDAARSADPRDPDGTAFFTLGLVLMVGHVIWDAAPVVADRAASALLAAASDAEPTALACDHGNHPCDDGDLDGQLENFASVLSLLAGGTDYDWDGLDEQNTLSDPEACWRCPHNVASFARWAATAIGDRAGSREATH